jgi:Kdo2-lipid IVA lauroyltransferase/acyltransferase
MNTLFHFLARWPLWLLHALGAALGWLAYLGSPAYRRRFNQNASQAGFGFAGVRAAVAHTGRMTAELPRLWLGKPVPVRWGDVSALEAAYREGKGIVFLTPHMGCFEVVAQGLAQRYAQNFGALTVLYRPARKAALAQVMEASRQRPGLDTAPTTLSGVRQMIKALRAGKAVGLLPDQVPPDGLGIWSPFFGRDAYTMTLGARLVQQTGATPLLCWGERLPWGRGFHLHFSKLTEPLAADLETAVAQINREMERIIATKPEQYLWGYARYKAPKQSAAPAPEPAKNASGEGA